MMLTNQSLKSSCLCSGYNRRVVQKLACQLSVVAARSYPEGASDKDTFIKEDYRK